MLVSEQATMDDAVSDDDARTITDRAFSLLKADIMSGVLKPNQRLRLEQVRARYNIGLTPLREALTRLSAMHLVVLDVQRGFRVAQASAANMRDVNKAREQLEVFLLGASIQNGDSSWEDRVVASFHVLKRRANQQTLSGPAFWEDPHKSFHFALIDQAGCPLLQSFHQVTWDQACRYRLLAHPQEDGGLLMDEHEQLMDAALSREKELACALLRRHIRIWPERALQAVPKEGA